MLSEEQWIKSYREHIDPLYGYVSRRTGGERSLAEDVVQETWLRALQQWRRKGLPREPQAWLRTVARNLLASHFRRFKPGSLEESHFEPIQVESPETAALVQWGLARLRRRQVRLLEAFHFDGKRVQEIAQELGISERAAEGRLRRARLALKDQLKPFLIVQEEINHEQRAT